MLRGGTWFGSESARFGGEWQETGNRDEPKFRLDAQFRRIAARSSGDWRRCGHSMGLVSHRPCLEVLSFRPSSEVGLFSGMIFNWLCQGENYEHLAELNATTTIDSFPPYNVSC